MQFAADRYYGRSCDTPAVEKSLQVHVPPPLVGSIVISGRSYEPSQTCSYNSSANLNNPNC